MREYGFPLSHILPYKDKIYDFVLIRASTGGENPHSCIFYAVYFILSWKMKQQRTKYWHGEESLKGDIRKHLIRLSIILPFYQPFILYLL